MMMMMMIPANIETTKADGHDSRTLLFSIIYCWTINRNMWKISDAISLKIYTGWGGRKNQGHCTFFWISRKQRNI